MRAEGTTKSLGVLKLFFYDNIWVHGGYFGLFYNLSILTSNKYKYYLVCGSTLLYMCLEELY